MQKSKQAQKLEIRLRKALGNAAVSVNDCPNGLMRARHGGVFGLEKKGTEKEILEYFNYEIKKNNIRLEEQKEFEKLTSKEQMIFNLCKEKNEENEKSINKYIELILTVEEKKGWKFSNSPYSNSFYYLPENENISWSYKPEGSLRISNHWSFEANGEIHCEIEGEIEVQELTICIFKNGFYERVGV